MAAEKKAVELVLQIVPGSEGEIQCQEEVHDIARQIGYPILIKARVGGGIRGMRVCFQEQDLKDALTQVQTDAEMSLAMAAFIWKSF